MKNIDKNTLSNTHTQTEKKTFDFEEVYNSVQSAIVESLGQKALDGFDVRDEELDLKIEDLTLWDVATIESITPIDGAFDFEVVFETPKKGRIVKQCLEDDIHFEEGEEVVVQYWMDGFDTYGPIQSIINEQNEHEWDIFARGASLDSFKDRIKKSD